jgi:hypothetical protein
MKKSAFKMKLNQTNLACFRPSISCTTNVVISQCCISCSIQYKALHKYLNMDIHAPLPYLVSMLEHYCVSSGLR